MRSMRWLIIWLACACDASIALDYRDDVHAVTFGHADPGDPHVVAILDVTDHPICTGVLVAPRVVVSAAHCFGSLEPVRVFFGADADVLPQGVVMPVVSRALHPEFQRLGLKNDIAVLVLEQPSTAPPVVLADAVEDRLEQGADIRVVGFGHTSVAGDSGHIKRFGTSRVVEMTADTFEIEPSPSQPCTGDSGGPAFLDTGDGERFVGVISSGDPDCADHSTLIRVDAHLNFIAGMIEACSIGSCDCDPSAPECADVGGCRINHSRQRTVPLVLFIMVLLFYRQRKVLEEE